MYIANEGDVSARIAFLVVDEVIAGDGDIFAGAEEELEDGEDFYEVIKLIERVWQWHTVRFGIEYISGCWGDHGFLLGLEQF